MPLSSLPCVTIIRRLLLCSNNVPIERVRLRSAFFRPCAPKIKEVLVCDATIACAHDGGGGRTVQRVRCRPAFAAHGWEVSGSGVDAGIAHMIRDDNNAKTNDDGSTARAPAEW